MTSFEMGLRGEFFNPATFSGAVFYWFVFLFFAWLGARAIGFAARQILKVQRGDQDLIDETTLTFVTQLGQIGAYLLAMTLYAHLIPALKSIGTVLLTGVSIVSVVIAIAAQSTLGNLISGISLLLYRPFKIGDRLQVYVSDHLETGDVESITLGYTILRTFDNRRIVVPNSAMSNKITINLTTKDPRLIVTVSFGISYQADIEKARGILLNLAKTHPLAQEVADCPVTGLGQSSVTLSLRVWCANAAEGKQLEFDLYEKAKNVFDREGIEIPFPYQNVILKNKEA
ncbi:MAG TPA: mechanosensitive ion channel family protein [Nitrospiria bacterium]|nr:mechanosensitive ion channel family protein [Nitrospiria bacterium]